MRRRKGRLTLSLSDWGDSCGGRWEVGCEDPLQHRAAPGRTAEGGCPHIGVGATAALRLAKVLLHFLGQVRTVENVAQLRWRQGAGKFEGAGQGYLSIA